MKKESLDYKAHQAAEAVRCYLAKAKGRRGPDNQGGYRLITASGGVAAGENFDLSPKDVIAICQTLWENHWASCRSDCPSCTEGLTEAEIQERKEREDSLFS